MDPGLQISWVNLSLMRWRTYGSVVRTWYHVITQEQNPQMMARRRQRPFWGKNTGSGNDLGLHGKWGTQDHPQAFYPQESLAPHQRLGDNSRYWTSSRPRISSRIKAPGSLGQCCQHVRIHDSLSCRTRSWTTIPPSSPHSWQEQNRCWAHGEAVQTQRNMRLEAVVQLTTRRLL